MRFGGFIMMAWTVAGVAAGPGYLPITGPTPIRFRAHDVTPTPLPPLVMADTVAPPANTSGDQTSTPGEEFSFPQPPATTNIVTAGPSSPTPTADPSPAAKPDPNLIIPISTGTQGIGRTTNLIHLIVRPEDLGLRRPVDKSDVSISGPDFIPAQSRATYESKPAP